MAKVAKEAIDRMVGDGYVTPAEGQRLTGRTTATLREWARSQQIRSRRSGINWFLHRADLMRVAGFEGNGQ